MIVKIKERLQNNETELLSILEDIGCHGIKPIQNRFQFGSDEYGRHTGNIINIDTLSYKSFSHNISGDIITLVSIMLHMDLGQSIKWLAHKLNIKMDYTRREVVKPFGGFWNELSKIKDMDDKPPKTYPKSILDEYGCSISKFFLDDGIDCVTQELFGIGYDIWTDRITIPWYSFDDLLGVMGRENREVAQTNYKYLALHHVQKSKTLFGLNINYKNILNEGVCYVFESEKSTMQTYSFDVKNSTSIGCKTISNIQSKILKSLYCDVILCFDEGVLKDDIIKECEKVKIKNPFFTNKVGYIYDKDNKYLKKGSKASPSDLGYDVFKNLLEECVEWI